MGGCVSGFNGIKCDIGIVYVVILNKMLKKIFFKKGNNNIFEFFCDIIFLCLKKVLLY